MNELAFFLGVVFGIGFLILLVLLNHWYDERVKRAKERDVLLYRLAQDVKELKECEKK